MRIIALIGVVLVCGLAWGGMTTDVYRLTMTLQIPRTYDNMESMGYRKYQTQRLTGEMRIVYREDSTTEVIMTNLVNQTQKIGGRKITYDTTVDEWMVRTRVNLIGDNEKDCFRTPSVVLYMDAEPSYNVGEDDEDNSLLGILSGKGTTVRVCEYATDCVAGRKVKVKTGEYWRINRLSGSFAGTLGCGCGAYGHVSPTRVAGPRGATDEVDDVAAAWGDWTARFEERIVE